VTGWTSSTTFITTTGGLQPGAGGGGNDAFVAKIGATRVITYAYDGVQRLTDAVECPGSTYHYGYDLASNRTLETVDGVAQQQVSYDAANQVITATTPQGTASYSYDQAGNLLSDGTRNYSYDALDRLTALAGAGATESYGYNGDGTLVTQTVNGIPTAYTQDLAAGQSQVLQTATGTGAPAVTDYLYGLDRLASVPSGGGARTWYMPDLQGSVRYTTDDGANASPTVNYDPYGTPEGGAVPPTFGYDGELQDGATGLQNLRARTYNPATGQFLTRDPLEQQTGQAYVYAGGDPVNGSDPSGLHRFTVWAAAFIAPTTINFIDPLRGDLTPTATVHGDGRSFWNGMGTPPWQRKIQQGKASSRIWNYLVVDDSPSASFPVVQNLSGVGESEIAYHNFTGNGGPDVGYAADPAKASVKRYTDTQYHTHTFVVIQGEGNIPIVKPYSPPIKYQYILDFDPTAGKLMVYGTHSAFPWHELLIKDGSSIFSRTGSPWQFAPAKGATPMSLVRFDGGDSLFSVLWPEVLTL